MIIDWQYDLYADIQAYDSLEAPIPQPASWQFEQEWLLFDEIAVSLEILEVTIGGGGNKQRILRKKKLYEEDEEIMAVISAFLMTRRH